VKIRAAILIAASTLALNACGKDNSPTQPTQPTTTQSQVKLVATMLPANEVPAVANAEASGSGNVTITLNLTKDASGTITASNVDFAVTATGFPSGTTLTAAHIHPGVAGTTGGVLVGAGIASGEVKFTDGSGGFTKTNQTITADQVNQILANPSAFYFNIHTALNPGGVARGQLRVQ
jgi:hypothetical protein